MVLSDKILVSLIMDGDGLEYLQVEREALARYGGRSGDSQLQAILRDWFPRLREKARDNGERLDHYRGLIADAQELLDSFRVSLFAHVNHGTIREGRWPLDTSDEKDDEEWLWRSPGTFQMDHQPPNWSDVSPVDRYWLERAIAEYIRRDWLQHNLIEWAAINALLFDEISRLKVAIRSGRVFKEGDWAYILTGNHEEKLTLWRAALALSAFAVRWMLPPLIITGLVYLEYLDAAKAVGGAWGLYAVYRAATWPARRRTRHQKEESLRRYGAMLEALTRAWVHSDSKVINPSRLKDLIVEAETKGAILSPALFSLLDRAIQRDPAAFVRPGRW